MKAAAGRLQAAVGNGSMTISAHVYTQLGIVDPRS
jgi:hypothetical protein